MVTITRKQLVAYYKEQGKKLPKMVADSDPKTKFAFGFMCDGKRAGYAPLHPSGRRVAKVYDMLSINPLTDSECKEFMAEDKKASRKR